MATKRLQAENPQLATRIEFGLLVAFTRATCPLYSPLCLNICREVFSYIALDHFYLAGIRYYELVVYDLPTESMQVTVPCLNIEISSVSFAMLNSNTILVVGGMFSERDVRSIHIWTGEITVEASMSTGRSWPGILVYKDFVWVFGGNTDPTLDSVERFHRTNRVWEIGTSMLIPKVGFTPCEYQHLIYLPDPTPQKNQLEVLNPVTEVYSLLPLELHSNLYSSVSFIVDNTLFVIDYNKKAGTWVLGSQDTQLTDLQISTKEVPNCDSMNTPIRHRETIYWLDSDFALVKFDLKTMTLETCKTGRI